jgi:hypothetical protein
MWDVGCGMWDVGMGEKDAIHDPKPQHLNPNPYFQRKHFPNTKFKTTAIYINKQPE